MSLSWLAEASELLLYRLHQPGRPNNLAVKSAILQYVLAAMHVCCMMSLCQALLLLLLPLHLLHQAGRTGQWLINSMFAAYVLQQTGICSNICLQRYVLAATYGCSNIYVGRSVRWQPYICAAQCVFVAAPLCSRLKWLLLQPIQRPQ